MLYRIARPARRGTLLVWFALMAFVIMSLAALTIDLGLVRVTQRTMESAADAAALEAVRERDLYITDPELVSDHFARVSQAALQARNDQQRRQRAADRIQLALADVGAGPTFGVTNGYAGGFANALPGVYVPQLQLNLDDSPEGDMVAGTCVNAPTVLHQEGVAGSGSFDRDDFLPGQPFGPCTTDGFLIRLRRSNDASESGVSSTGPVLPYLVGQGSSISAQAKSVGLTVRAVGIAATSVQEGYDPIDPIPGRVKSAGPPVRTVNGQPLPRPIPGFTPFVLYFVDPSSGKAIWQNATVLIRALKPIPVNVDPATGLLSIKDGTTIGFAFQDLAAPITHTLSLGQSPGAPVPIGKNWTSLLVDRGPQGTLASRRTSLYGYVPVVQYLGKRAPPIIVGFGMALLDPVDPPSESQFKMTILPGRTFQSGVVAPANASALVATTTPWLQQALAINQTMRDSVMSPVLVRSMGPP
jgi:hypothetical protein